MTGDSPAPPGYISGRMNARNQSESRAAASRAAAEELVRGILDGVCAGVRSGAEEEKLIEDILRFRSGEVRVLVLGGGTGLSTVVGGESKLPDWPRRPFVGLKEVFSRLTAVVVTTDDGGSTGRLLKQLPMIGIGDLRKCFLSLVRAENLRRRWKLDERGVSALVRVLAGVFNYRFPESGADRRVFRDPLRAVPQSLRAGCPKELAAGLASLTGCLSPRGEGPTVMPEGHCLGNLLLTAAVFRAAGRSDRPPSNTAVRKGVDRLARLAGVEPGSLHAATATPGQLKFLYANGVEVYGQYKSARARRGCPVERVTAEFIRKPVVPRAVLEAVRRADLIVYAPGSLYTSMIPLLQIRPLAETVRANRGAVKILAANFWIQEGETDISPRGPAQGFLVSDLVESYNRTIPGGVGGLFDTILSAGLDHVPARILRNYALEGKVPIHLDRRRVEAMGFRPVEVPLFPPPRPGGSSAIHHDPVNFALAVRALYYVRRVAGSAPGKKPRSLGPPSAARVRPPAGTGIPLCRYREEMASALRGKRFRPRELQEVMLDLAWENRDIRPGHFSGFRGVRLIGEGDWQRSTEWDNVLGYFDPDDRELKIHRRLLKRPERLREDLLIALGESLLGRYLEKRRWPRPLFSSDPSARCYEIRLRPPGRRECYLSDRQLHRYLRLTRMVPHRKDPLVYRITINDREGFLPPGLLFGLLYAWYLDDAYGSLMDYEMALLRWPEEALMPYQVQERRRKQALVDFFREEVFRP